VLDVINLTYSALGSGRKHILIYNQLLLIRERERVRERERERERERKEGG